MSKFVYTLQLQLREPAELTRIVKNIESSFAGIDANVRVNIRSQGVSSVISEVKKLNQATKETNNTAEALAKTFAISFKRFVTFSIATRAVGAFTSGISGAFNEAVDFEKQMVRVSQVTGKTLPDLRDLNKEITRLSITLGVSSKKLLNVSLTLSQAGFTARDTKVALDALAKTELAATFTDIEKTTEGAIALFNQFGQGAEALAGQLGAINKVSADFAVESDDLIDVVRRAGGVFKAMGSTVGPNGEVYTSLEQLIAIFTSVRATTRESAESIGTALKTIFVRIQRPKTIEYLKSMGVELLDAEKKFIGPTKAVEALHKAFAGLEQGDPRFIQIAEELGGYRQIGKVIPLIQEAAIMQKALNSAKKGGASLDKDAEIAQISLANRITKVKEEFSALVRAIYESPVFQVMANSSLQLASALVKVATTLKDIIPLIGAFAALKIAKTSGSFLGSFGRNLKNPQGFASGGPVPGVGNKDSVPAMLMPGEFVLNKKTVSKIGVGKLNAINSGVQYFAHGGVIPGAGNTDTVPAMLTPGEFVLNKKAVKKHGLSKLIEMNGGRDAGTTKNGVPHFSGGGLFGGGEQSGGIGKGGQILATLGIISVFGQSLSSVIDPASQIGKLFTSLLSYGTQFVALSAVIGVGQQKAKEGFASASGMFKSYKDNKAADNTMKSAYVNKDNTADITQLNSEISDLEKSIAFYSEGLKDVKPEDRAELEKEIASQNEQKNTTTKKAKYAENATADFKEKNIYKEKLKNTKEAEEKIEQLKNEKVNSTKQLDKRGKFDQNLRQNYSSLRDEQKQTDNEYQTKALDSEYQRKTQENTTKKTRIKSSIKKNNRKTNSLNTNISDIDSEIPALEDTITNNKVSRMDKLTGGRSGKIGRGLSAAKNLGKGFGLGPSALVGAGLVVAGGAVSEVGEKRKEQSRSAFADSDFSKGKSLSGAGTNMKTAGSALTSAGIGVALGATIGSVIPGVGTAIGAAVGGVVGALYGVVDSISMSEQALSGMNDDIVKASISNLDTNKQKVESGRITTTNFSKRSADDTKEGLNSFNQRSINDSNLRNQTWTNYATTLGGTISDRGAEAAARTKKSGFVQNTVAGFVDRAVPGLGLGSNYVQTSVSDSEVAIQARMDEDKTKKAERDGEFDKLTNNAVESYKYLGQRGAFTAELDKDGKKQIDVGAADRLFNKNSGTLDKEIESRKDQVSILKSSGKSDTDGSREKIAKQTITEEINRLETSKQRLIIAKKLLEQEKQILAYQSKGLDIAALFGKAALNLNIGQERRDSGINVNEEFNKNLDFSLANKGGSENFSKSIDSITKQSQSFVGENDSINDQGKQLKGLISGLDRIRDGEITSGKAPLDSVSIAEQISNVFAAQDGLDMSSIQGSIDEFASSLSVQEMNDPALFLAKINILADKLPVGPLVENFKNINASLGSFQKALTENYKALFDASKSKINTKSAALDVQQDGRQFLAEFGGKAFTPADELNTQKQKTQLFENEIGIRAGFDKNADGMTTGISLKKDETFAKGIAGKNDIEKSKFVGEELQKRVDLKNSGTLTADESSVNNNQIGQYQELTSAYIDGKKKEIELIKKSIEIETAKNQLNKESIKDLANGDIMSFFKKQQTVAAQSALESGDKRLQQSFGSSALASAAQNYEQRKAGGETGLDDRINQAYSASSSRMGLNPELSASLLSDPKVDKLKQQGRQASTELSQLGVDKSSQGDIMFTGAVTNFQLAVKDFAATFLNNKLPPNQPPAPIQKPQEKAKEEAQVGAQAEGQIPKQAGVNKQAAGMPDLGAGVRDNFFSEQDAKNMTAFTGSVKELSIALEKLSQSTIKIEVAPTQVSVNLTAPDILGKLSESVRLSIGEQMKKEIISEINKMAGNGLLGK